MEVLKQAGKFLFGDSKLSADDIQKLKADFRSVSCIVEEFLDLREKLISEEIQISCQSCAKKQKIQNTKNALYVATYQTTPKSLRESSTEDKDYDKRTTYGKETTQCESSVDRSSRDEEYKHDGMNDSFITKGEESYGDVKTDANDDKIEKEKKVLEDKLNKTEKNLQKAEKVILDLRKKMEEAESKYDGELKSAVIELSKITNEKEENEKSIGILESKIKQLNLELSALKENFDKKDKECKHYSSCLERNKQTHETIVSQMNTEQDSLRADLFEKRSLIETMKRRKSELAQGCHKKDEEINSLERKVKESERNTTSKAEQIEKLNQVVETLNSNGAQKDEEISSLKERIDDLLSDNNNKGEQINFLGEELKTMQHILEDERKGHKSIKASLEEEILGLKADLTAWEERTKKTLVINFHTSLKQSLALPAQQHIEQCLKEKCQLDNVTLEVKQYKSPESTPGPILVLCMNVSRLGTDVKEALKGTPGNYEVLVVVLHHKEVHALPSQASDRVLTGEEYKQLGAIVDAAFWTGRGMYDCDLNKLATEKIYNFVSGFVTR